MQWHREVINQDLHDVSLFQYDKLWSHQACVWLFCSNDDITQDKVILLKGMELSTVGMIIRKGKQTLKYQKLIISISSIVLGRWTSTGPQIKPLSLERYGEQQKPTNQPNNKNSYMEGRHRKGSWKMHNSSKLKDWPTLLYKFIPAALSITQSIPLV